MLYKVKESDYKSRLEKLILGQVQIYFIKIEFSFDDNFSPEIRRNRITLYFFIFGALFSWLKSADALSI